MYYGLEIVLCTKNITINQAKSLLFRSIYKSERFEFERTTKPNRKKKKTVREIQGNI